MLKSDAWLSQSKADIRPIAGSHSPSFTSQVCSISFKAVRWILNIAPSQPSISSAMQYTAIEFMPMTHNGKTRRRKPQISTSQYQKAKNQKVQPAAKTAHEGVQMRLTIGQNE